jgi:hypothetical protein
MKTVEIVINDDKYYQKTLEVKGTSRYAQTMILAKAKDNGEGIGSDYVYLYPIPEQVRLLRKALQTREDELVSRGFLDAEQEEGR